MKVILIVGMVKMINILGGYIKQTQKRKGKN